MTTYKIDYVLTRSATVLINAENETEARRAFYDTAGLDGSYDVMDEVTQFNIKEA